MWMNGCPRILWNLSLVLWVDWWTVWCWKKSVVPQSCLTLWDPMDSSLPGFSVLKIFQARILEWVAISFSRGSFRPKDRTWASCIAIRLFMVWATKYNTTAKQSHTWVVIKKKKWWRKIIIMCGSLGCQERLSDLCGYTWTSVPFWKVWIVGHGIE